MVLPVTSSLLGFCFWLVHYSASCVSNSWGFGVLWLSVSQMSDCSELALLVGDWWVTTSSLYENLVFFLFIYSKYELDCLKQLACELIYPGIEICAYPLVDSIVFFFLHYCLVGSINSVVFLCMPAFALFLLDFYAYRLKW